MLAVPPSIIPQHFPDLLCLSLCILCSICSYKGFLFRGFVRGVRLIYTGVFRSCNVSSQYRSSVLASGYPL
jgi:hypothetical protein